MGDGDTVRWQEPVVDRGAMQEGEKEGKASELEVDGTRPIARYLCP